jgi:hypothetical protein
MELLTAYNICLRAVNESPISDIETESYIVAQIEPLLDSKRQTILLKGFPFNTHTMTLTADDSDQIVIPATYLKIRFPAAHQERLTVYNGKVYDRTTQEYWSTDLTVEVVLDIAFAEIPEAYAQWIAREAAVEFEVQVHGLTAAYQFLKKQANQAMQTACNSEFVSIDTMSGFTSLRGAYGA